MVRRYYTVYVLGLSIGLLVGYQFRQATEPDARTQALDWFFSQPHEEQAAFVDVQLGSDKKRRWIAHRWCSLNPGDDWACDKAGMGNPVFKGGK